MNAYLDRNGYICWLVNTHYLSEASTYLLDMMLFLMRNSGDEISKPDNILKIKNSPEMNFLPRKKKNLKLKNQLKKNPRQNHI